MRVIAGKYKRRNLSTLLGSSITRPTSDRVRENIFNIISDIISDAVVLDLFAGSGAMGIEALSRGAKKVTFVEIYPDAINNIQKNLNSLSILPSEYSLVKSDATEFLITSPKNLKYDIIFADPPYQSDWYKSSFSELENSKLCSEDCVVIFEMALGSKMILPTLIENWDLCDERNYGNTRIEIWKRGK